MNVNLPGEFSHLAHQRSYFVLNTCRGDGLCFPEGGEKEKHSFIHHGRKLVWLQENTSAQVLDTCYKLLVRSAIEEDLKSWMECIIKILDAILFITSKELLNDVLCQKCI